MKINLKQSIPMNSGPKTLEAILTFRTLYTYGGLSKERTQKIRVLNVSLDTDETKSRGHQFQAVSRQKEYRTYQFGELREN